MLYRYNSRIDLTSDFEEDDHPTELKIENVALVPVMIVFFLVLHIVPSREQTVAADKSENEDKRGRPPRRVQGVGRGATGRGGQSAITRATAG